MDREAHNQSICDFSISKDAVFAKLNTGYAALALTVKCRPMHSIFITPLFSFLKEAISNSTNKSNPSIFSELVHGTRGECQCYNSTLHANCQWLVASWRAVDGNASSSLLAATGRPQVDVQRSASRNIAETNSPTARQRATSGKTQLQIGSLRVGQMFNFPVKNLYLHCLVKDSVWKKRSDKMASVMKINPRKWCSMRTKY